MSSHHHAHHAGTGCATGVAGTPGWIQQVSLTFGLTITVLAYTIGGRSGGHINGAAGLEGTMLGPSLFSGRVAGG